jgi:ABC-type lipoprotein export system ATPase subunit
MPDPIIIGKDIHKTYRSGKIQLHALKGVSLEVMAGEMAAVMGPSGCGKSTLLNCLSGLDQFDSGEVVIEGASLRDMNDKDRTRYRAQRMGFVFQTFNLLPVLTAVENVEFPLLVSGTRPAQARQRALVALDRVTLADWAHHRPAELSGGQRQRVAVARALVNDPALIWADEPTGNLDSEAAAGVLAMMRQLNREQGQTFIVVTHDREMAAMCDRIIQMRDGQIVADGVRSV